MASRRCPKEKISKRDSIDDAIEKNDKLYRKVKRLERENKKLKSENKTLEEAWKKTEEYLIEITEGTTKAIKKVRKKCPNCSGRVMNTIKSKGIEIIMCGKCGYRNRLNNGCEEKS